MRRISVAEGQHRRYWLHKTRDESMSWMDAEGVQPEARGRGFYTHTFDGHTMHVNGDRAMSQDLLDALRHMMDLAVKQYGGK